ncbi:alpha/beta fold hydrolase [Longispora fulva]|uniref:Pimeloyl-ACP methyl ester carboxylesterase/ASC-1-like (ASCH) protein n=2 Tax=Longispora fulva TaxID=619741 RepID=A0A8J7KP97_9ACTN|nr:alpha/beta fold hydrolase [Longispora fulva]MBG6136062.1 pimeloyl-ACP methyl ester carboxylesterase/ASC-1-like (ASCH) protein [Longispora fulva]
MHLRRPYFDLVASGRKVVEVRVCYPRNDTLSVGEQILFVCDADEVLTTITGLARYPSFEHMLNTEDPTRINPDLPRAEQLRDLREIYGPDKERLGVLAIQIALAKPPTVSLDPARPTAASGTGQVDHNEGKAVVLMIEVESRAVAAVIEPGDDPAVVFVSALGEPAAVWSPVRSLLTAGSRTLAYDRAGIGASPARPTDQRVATYQTLASELHATLAGAGIASPWVLVGHSVGALIVRAFAQQWPGEVAGLVLVDSSVPELELWPGNFGDTVTDGAGPHATIIDLPAAAAEFAQEHGLAVPVVVLSKTPGRWFSPQATPEVDAYWQTQQRLLADRYGATRIIAADASHRLHEEAPALVAYTIDAVVAATRTSQPLTIDTARVAELGGQAT